eukprot:7014269-Lingulodinium_polyedra.AAC.1
MCQQTTETEGSVSKSAMGPKAHKRLEVGLSIENKAPAREQVLATSDENKANSTPRRSFSLALPRRRTPRRPMLHTEQGVPMCT